MTWGPQEFFVWGPFQAYNAVSNLDKMNTDFYQNEKEEPISDGL